MLCEKHKMLLNFCKTQPSMLLHRIFLPVTSIKTSYLQNYDRKIVMSSSTASLLSQKVVQIWFAYLFSKETNVGFVIKCFQLLETMEQFFFFLWRLIPQKKKNAKNSQPGVQYLVKEIAGQPVNLAML